MYRPTSVATEEIENESL